MGRLFDFKAPHGGSYKEWLDSDIFEEVKK
jgi:hypothetical protein